MDFDAGQDQYAEERKWTAKDIAPDANPFDADLPDVAWAYGDSPCDVQVDVWEKYNSTERGDEIAAATVRRLRCDDKPIEPGITATLRAAAESADAAAVDLEYRMKSPASLARKLHDKLPFDWDLPVSDFLNEPPDDSEADMTDTLRYTILVESDNQVVTTTQRVICLLQAAGLEPVSAHHSYHEGSPYKGLDFVWRFGSGHPFELQIHSDLSWQVKQETHPWYEISRDPSRSTAEKCDAERQCVELSRKVPNHPELAQMETIGGITLDPPRQRFTIRTADGGDHDGN